MFSSWRHWGEERRKMEVWQPTSAFLDRGYIIEHLHGAHLRCLWLWLLPALLSLQQANGECRQWKRTSDKQAPRETSRTRDMSDCGTLALITTKQQ